MFVVSGLPVAGLIGLALIPSLGWRAMFVLGGLGALGVWYARKSLPESPRWLDSVGRHDEADAILRRIEQEVDREHVRRSTLPAAFRCETLSSAAAAGVRLAVLPRDAAADDRRLRDAHCHQYAAVDGFVPWLRTFFVHQGFSIAKSFGSSRS